MRVQMGFVKTPDRVVDWVSKMLTPEVEENRTVTIVDPCVGEGMAVSDLRKHWMARYPDLKCKILGCEADKGRALKANELLMSGAGGGECLWSEMEDVRISSEHEWMEGVVVGASLMWINPAYDNIRGQGRMEQEQLKHTIEWPVRGHGLIVLIVPTYVLEDEDTGVAIAVERNYTVLRRMKFPEPEYQDFKQCVVIARRRAKALNSSIVHHPVWATKSGDWPVMYDKGSPKPIMVVAQSDVMELKRVRLGVSVIKDFVDSSPVRGQMLQDALAEAPKIGRPPLSLSSGHLALALSGGLCDGVIQNGPDDRFLVKGSLKSCVRKTGRKEKTDKDGVVTHDIDIFKTRYEMLVRCLRTDGTIEEYTSADPNEELAAAGAITGEGEDGEPEPATGSDQ